MLVEFSSAEEKALEALSQKKEMSVNAVIRQAVKLYHLVSIHKEQGLELAWTKNGKLYVDRTLSKKNPNLKLGE